MEKVYDGKENLGKILDYIDEGLKKGYIKSMSDAAPNFSRLIQRVDSYVVQSPFTLIIGNVADMKELGYHKTYTFIGEDRNLNDLEKKIGIESKKK